MRTLRLAFLIVFALGAAALLAANMTPQAEFSSVRDYAVDDLQRLSDELRVDRLLLTFDPFNAGPDLIPKLAVSVPALVFVMTALGLFAGVLLESVRARKLRRELREKRDEAIMLKAELHHARQTLKDSDHPASAAPATRR